MGSHSLYMILLLAGITFGSRPNVTRPFRITGFLEKYGYLDDLPPGQENVGHAPQARASAITEFQSFNGLPVTGNLDRRTIRKMKSPRCGLPDVVKPKDRIRGQRLSAGSPTGRNSPLAFYAPGYKWNKNRVTWKIKSFTRQLGGPEQRRSYYNAFKKWTDVSGIKVSESSGSADIEISYGTRDHGDGRGNSFDGEGGTLAHAFFPGDPPISGDTHFDESEVWTLGEDRGTNLEIVAAHEFGHALGLGHSNIPDALMAPFYQGYDANYGLHNDDIMAIRSLYPRRNAPVTTARPRTTRRPRTTTRPRRTTSRPRTTRRPGTTRRPRTTRRPGTTPSRCRFRFDAILRAHNGRTYVFIKRYVYQVNSRGIVWNSKKRIRELFPRAPIKSVGAATHHSGKTYMFKGSKVWRFTGFNIDRGFPKRLSNAAYKGTQAAIGRTDGIYLFKKRNYTYWREDMRAPPTGYPVPIPRRWTGIPKMNIDAAMVAADGYIYFFKGTKYWKMDSRTYQTVPGYPKPKANAWLPGCGQRASR